MKTSTTTYCLLAALSGLAAAQSTTILELPEVDRDTTIVLASDGNGGLAGAEMDSSEGTTGGGGEDLTAETFEALDMSKAPLRLAFAGSGGVFDEPLQRSGPVTFLGVSAIPVPHELAAHLPLDEDTGLGVEGVVADGPAAKAGLAKSDVLMKLDDQILIHPRQLSVLVANHKEGDSVKLTYLRKGEVKEATVTLGKREEQGPKGGSRLFYKSSFGSPEPLRTYTRRFEVKPGNPNEAPRLDEVKQHLDELRNNVDFQTAKAKQMADTMLSEQVHRAAESAYSAEVQRAIQEAKQADAAKDAAESATKVEIDELRTKLDAVLKLLEEKK
ncbi:S1C family serine protease [Luteolibacter sp. Populi]|uniref:S1C family serine protease n=1 Tax=Luteolibacter sp. Populi TaxID=3230487 RepID=UPI003465B776